MSTSRFVGYSSQPPQIGESIEAAAKMAKFKVSVTHEIATWPQVFAYGEIIDENIFSAIDESEFCYFDVSVPNFNVLYEAGYAIGRGKPVIPLVNNSLANAGEYLQEIGIFDTVGIAFYANSQSLLDVFSAENSPRPIVSPHIQVNSAQPLYAIRPKIVDERFARLFSALDESGVNYRSFDASEDPRISARSCLQNVEESTGIVCGIAPDTLNDAEMHNIRAAFVGGLAAGKDKNVLFLNMSGQGLPLDVRDAAKIGDTIEKIDREIRDFAFQSLKSLQAVEPGKPVPSSTSRISEINLGNSAAENEARRLPEYFIETPAFRQTIDGHARVVIGRKGSGKTAIFSMARDHLSGGRKNLVLALKPDGFQLRKFKDKIIDLLEEGTKEHTIAAFWEYVLLLELLNHVIVQDAKYVGRDHHVTEKLPTLREKYRHDDFIHEGDFSERIGLVLDNLTQRLPADTNSDKGYLSRKDLTDLLYKHDIAALKHDIFDYLSLKDVVALLVDNVDKAWESSGVSADDILIVRSLLEAGRKLERGLAKIDVQSFSVIFLRNDIYELLIDQTPDRGKEGKVAIDWTDSEYLKMIVRKRLSLSGNDVKWSNIAVTHVDGTPSFDWVLDRTLMRPRYLIDFVGKCLGVASAREHERIEEGDFRSAYGSYSLDVLVSTNLEIRDVNPEFYDTIFALKELPAITDRINIGLALLDRQISDDKHDQVVDLLIWYGVLGCIRDDGTAQYIYEVEYNSHVLEQLRVNKGKDSERFEVNPAFWPALNIDGRGDAEPSVRLL